ncbi:maleylpyruvate isomerase N-terminal domain-containing protein [Rubellimicrobium sp. CFH 75288]|uniref:maleylpyruvate isomerase N-terminal domain-containing protein n=1 Tax=Rubellimicrobium sp. CFH 75288 TaxID=2697034 RepID=UPI0014127332|nr:maleylpyruvate isomerase N-terminal domain-containing protein [Rubellimicrobium sp. CFH 75288]NAZ36668.1 maleylpyruvate isomerase [Rubellimicrobium sp. CFH 75288]
MTGQDDSGRAALRARQGAGARYDAEAAPHADLLLARRGTAYFARKLNELDDRELDAPSLQEGWTRRRLVARVSLQARGLAIALKALREPLILEEAEWRPDLALAATLPARALRHLFVHSAKHLDVEWRDLPGEGWDGPRIRLDGAEVAPRQTPRLRAIAVWHASVDLGNGGRWRDVPEECRI